MTRDYEPKLDCGPYSKGFVGNLQAENAKLRAEVNALHAAIEDWHNGYGETGKANGWPRPATHLDALRELREESCELDGPDMKKLRAEVAELRKQAEAAAAAPSDAEIDAAITELIGAHRIDAGLDGGAFPPGFVKAKREKLVALMRRARAAPAPSALVAAAQKAIEWLDHCEYRGSPTPGAHRDCSNRLRAALAASPEPASVAVPEDVRGYAQHVLCYGELYEARKCADWILSLAAGAPAAPQPDEELQRLLTNAKNHAWCMSPNEHALLGVVEALARKAGAK